MVPDHAIASRALPVPDTDTPDPDPGPEVDTPFLSAQPSLHLLRGEFSSLACVNVSQTQHQHSVDTRAEVFFEELITKKTEIGKGNI